MKTITTIQEFAEEVTGSDGLFAVSELREGMTFQITEKHINNDGHATGISICTQNSNMAPTIYLDYYFEEFKKLGADEEAMTIVLDKIENCYLDAIENVPKVDVSDFQNFEWAKERLSAKLVNTEANREWLDKIAHKEYGDLSAVLMVLVAEGASVTVKNEYVDLWETSVDELLSIAVDNIQKDVEARSMAEVLAEIMGEEAADMFIARGAGEPPMTVVSNRRKVYGSAALLSREFLRNFGKKNGSYWIIPSSVHELIFVNDGENVDAEMFSEMVKDVNRTQVAPNERLSNTVYYYDAEKDELQFGETKECIA